MPKKKELKTFFEQVPLKIVKKIAKLELPDDEDSNGVDTMVEPPTKK